MDFLSIAFRNAIPQERKYVPYVFDGNWLPVERNIVKASVDPHITPDDLGRRLVLPTFNNWVFCKWGSGFYYARRATWDMGGLSSDTAQGLADEIARYYNDSGLG